MLWQDGAVTGIVDWASARIGAPGVDVGHCRWNLARALGQDAADRFPALAGADGHHPYWDVVAALGGYDAAVKTPAEEEFLARAVARSDACRRAARALLAPAAAGGGSQRPGPAGRPAWASSTSSSTGSDGRAPGAGASAASSAAASAAGSRGRRARIGAARRSRHGYAAGSSAPNTGRPVSPS